MDKESQMNKNLVSKLTCVLSRVLKQWVVILACMVICGIGFDIYKTVRYQPLYSSTVKVALMKEGQNSFRDSSETSSFTSTLNYLFSSRTARDAVESELGFTPTYHVFVSTDDSGGLFVINVRDESKKLAYQQLHSLMNFYNENHNNYQMNYEMKVIDTNYISTLPSNMNSHRKNLQTGALVGLCLTLSLIVTHAWLLDTVKSEGEIASHIDCRLLGVLPFEKKKGSRFKTFKKNKAPILISNLTTSFAYVESVKKIRSKIEASCTKHGYKTIMVTSSLENEGKSSVACNLAIALARNNAKVMIIDCDLRKPAIHKIFDIKSEQSINRFLEGKSNWHDETVYLRKFDLYVMQAKADVENAESLLESDRFRKRLEEMKAYFDYIIIDCSPSRYLNDPVLVSDIVDATVLVLKQDFASAETINETVSKLVNSKNNLIGCIYNRSVVNLMKETRVANYRYGYYNYKKGDK